MPSRISSILVGRFLMDLQEAHRKVTHFTSIQGHEHASLNVLDDSVCVSPFIAPFASIAASNYSGEDGGYDDSCILNAEAQES